MQLKTAPNVVSNTLPNTTQYSIKASAKAFKILSDGLYSDKIAAPIRELSTNAYDAHVAKGNIHTPFDVHLPSVAEPWFSIRDYGIGMSKQELETTYTTYFDSNKTHSNDFVGCMGLGSKTPFTLSDAFTVTSVKDGKKTTVINYLDADVPNFSIISEENTDEASGTEIKFTPTEANTYDKLRESAQRILGYFDVTPNLTIGSTKEEVKVPTKRLEGKDWYYVDSQLTYSDSIILMGNVAYPFNFSDVSDDFEKKHGWSNTYEYRRLVSNLVFRVPIGNLDVTASREEIGWTSEGREYMVNFVERVYNEIKDIMNEQLNDCENFWDARILFNSMVGYNEEYYSDIDRNGSGSIGHFKWTEKLSWNGIDVSERYGDVSKNPNLEKMDYRLFWLGSPKRNRYHGADKVNRRSDVNGIIPFDADVEFFQNDLPTGSVSRINHYVRENKNKVVLVFDEFTDKERNYLKLIGYPNKVSVTSELEKPPTNRSSSTTTKDSVIAYEKINDYGWNSAGNWSSEEEIALNTKDTIYYVPIRNWKIYFHDSEYSNTCKLNTLLNKVIEQDDVKIYGIKYAQTKKLTKYDNFKNVFDVISDYIESSFKNKTGSLYQSVIARKFYHFKHDGSYKVVNNLLNNRVFKRVCVLLKESGNTDTIKELMKIRRIININNHSEKNVSDEESQSSHDFENFTRYTNIHCERNLYSYFTSKVSYTLKNIPHMLSQEYPMVRFMGSALDGSGSYTNSMENLIEYMELVNSTKK
jgi:hypothetical protein